MKKSVDYNLFFAIIGLIIFGMMMISSVSIWSSHRVTSSMADAGLISEAYNHFYVLRNIIHVGVSMIVLGILVKIPIRTYEYFSRALFGLAIVLLIAVLFIGESYKGATGWLSIPGIPFNIQPTEFLKFAFVVYLAAFFKQNKKYLGTLEGGFLPFLFILGSILFLVGAQPDFGTILVIVPLGTIMFFLAGANIRYFLGLFVIGMIFAGGVYLAGDYDKETGKNLNNLGYITQRIDNFIADNKDAIKNETINYQTKQSLIAVGSGGFAGLGFGSSVQKFGYLPEVQGDFIFSVIVEELGFLGGVTILGLFGFITYRGFYIARYSDDLFAKYAAYGITTWISLQACINIGVNLNIVPLTGITLPFLSYGGSSLLSLTMGYALLLVISRDIHIPHQRTYSRNIAYKFQKTFSSWHKKLGR